MSTHQPNRRPSFRSEHVQRATRTELLRGSRTYPETPSVAHFALLAASSCCLSSGTASRWMLKTSLRRAPTGTRRWCLAATTRSTLSARFSRSAARPTSTELDHRMHRANSLGGSRSCPGSARHRAWRTSVEIGAWADAARCRSVLETVRGYVQGMHQPVVQEQYRRRGIRRRRQRHSRVQVPADNPDA